MRLKGCMRVLCSAAGCVGESHQGPVGSEKGEPGGGEGRIVEVCRKWATKTGSTITHLRALWRGATCAPKPNFPTCQNCELFVPVSRHRTTVGNKRDQGEDILGN